LVAPAPHPIKRSLMGRERQLGGSGRRWRKGARVCACGALPQRGKGRQRLPPTAGPGGV